METAQSRYAVIDDAINHWVKRHGLVLSREWQGEARFWYTSRAKECFQISIDQPIGDTVTIHAFSIETDDDAELRGEWSVCLGKLEHGLTIATAFIDLCMKRDRLVR